MCWSIRSSAFRGRLGSGAHGHIMAAVVGREVFCVVQVVVGVDTHQDQHLAVAIDHQGVRLAQRSAPSTSYGYGQLERWCRKLGEGHVGWEPGREWASRLTGWSPLLSWSR